MIVWIDDDSVINTDYIVGVTGTETYTHVWWPAFARPTKYEIPFDEFIKKIGWDKFHETLQ